MIELRTTCNDASGDRCTITSDRMVYDKEGMWPFRRWMVKFYVNGELVAKRNIKSVMTSFIDREEVIQSKKTIWRWKVQWNDKTRKDTFFIADQIEHPVNNYHSPYGVGGIESSYRFLCGCIGDDKVFLCDYGAILNIMRMEEVADD